MINKPIEVLSPAGSPECIVAAVQTGADAIYLGLGNLNARRGATNFTKDEVKQAVMFCHTRGVKVYLTLNTIVTDREIREVLKVLEFACSIGMDAIIVQDLGVASLIKSVAPQMRIHASTQMTVHNLEGVQKLSKLGFSRVVLAREMSREDIKLAAEQTDIELEVFIHGALCMSMSGQCYLSSVIGGRSGNRGLCAQPCRLPFGVKGGTGWDLSLKDLSLVEHITELSEMGVTSIKIEGRMKRPEYVAAATAVCHTAANGKIIEVDMLDALRAVYSRSGFTKGYYMNKRDKDMFGTRKLADVKAAEGVLRELSNTYKDEMPRIKIDFSFLLKEGQACKLTATDIDGNESYVNGIIPGNAKTRAINEEIIITQLQKTGGTPFYAGNISIDLDEGLNLPASEMNRMRREALSDIYTLRERLKPVPYNKPNLDVEDIGYTDKPKLQIRFASIHQIPVDFGEADMLWLPISEIVMHSQKVISLMEQGYTVGAELPRLMFSNAVHQLNEALEQVSKIGIKDVICGNIGFFEMVQKAGFNVHGDFGLNISNSQAIEAIGKIGIKSTVLSFELTLQQIEKLSKPIPCSIIAYGNLPVMLVRNCPNVNAHECKGMCRESGELVDRTNEHFPIVCGEGEYAEILNSRPLYLADRLNEISNIGLQFIKLYFTNERDKKCNFIIKEYKSGGTQPDKFTRGLYFRGVD